MISNKSPWQGRDSEVSMKGRGRGGEEQAEVGVVNGAGADGLQRQSSRGGGDLVGSGISPKRGRRLPWLRY